MADEEQRADQDEKEVANISSVEDEKAQLKSPFVRWNDEALDSTQDLKGVDALGKLHLHEWFAQLLDNSGLKPAWLVSCSYY